ncbi:FAD-dependent oxidoreductase [Primorskyibacter aestuariivivens]|uniref:FAD-dependent oxidoreductase n=1 Tax=Primorskyibacter aestuariivivens TaxID=1888912 RepID=UPI00230161BE|nr:FAD-dependent oxidoreductase [Primorskyibacter aestuariivivens]MDA7429973.1 FAD-dependent oxidoreductase [Primorskyibacter aestuariivivens]
MSAAPVTVARDGDLALVTIDNPPVNATSTAVRAGLLRAVDEVAGARLAILRCAGKTFVAGGDMSEFDALPVEPHLPDVIQAIEDSTVPFLALMHGSVLGGGFEIAMGCAWRIAERGTRFGLPEVNVGLVPGAGGTQRAPRLVGMALAIDMAASGRMVSAPEMLEAGGLDAVFDGDAEAAARDFAADLPARPMKVSARETVPMGAAALEAKRAEIAKRAKGQQSPLLNLEALQWALLPFEKGQPRERALHLDLRQSDESRALRHAFFAEREVSRPAALKGAEPRNISRVAVIGGGLMGAGIAAAGLSGGYAVTLIERDAEAAAAAQARVSGLIEGTVKRGKLSAEKAAAQQARFTASAGYDAARDADLAIEAVFEDLDTKRAVFDALADVMRPDAILATNTSYLDPCDIFAGIASPERCLGLHFFSPAHVMKLLEVVPLPETAPEVLATGFSLGKALRKVSVLAGICDGFIGNRMLAEYRRLAEYLLADGCLPGDVDAAARALGLPMGPFELQDLTGLQIAWANRLRQAATRDPAQRYVTIADRLCEMGRLGQRSGKGWYDYEEGSRAPVPSPEVQAVIQGYSRDQGLTRTPLDKDEISTRILAVLANEGARIVEDGIAESDAAVDMVQIHGYGFPRRRGGPMHAAGAVGWDRIAATMAWIAEESPGSWVLSEQVKGAL